MAVKTSSGEKPATKVKSPAARQPLDSHEVMLLSLLRRAFDISAQDDDGWVHLGALGHALQRIEPSFDSRSYGFKSLSLLSRSLPKYLEVKGVKKTGASIIYVRLKDE